MTQAIDLSFWGESEGKPGHLISPEIYSDDFSAAVDYLSTQPYVDPENIGMLGICGSGSFVISAAKIDPRMKAIATVSMYDMGAAFRHGLNHSQTPDQRKALIQSAIEQRFAEFKGSVKAYIPGTVNKLDDSIPAIQREFFDFYRTERGGYTPQGEKEGLTTKPLLSSIGKFMNSISPETRHKGDFMLYGSQNLVLFHDTFRTTYSYTPIGRVITSDTLQDTVGHSSIT